MGHTMVERVARAIYESNPLRSSYADFESERSEFKRTCYVFARAAIAAMPIDADDAATTVYGRLLNRHLQAARSDFHGPVRARLFEIIEFMRETWPAECKVWEDRYSDAALSEPKGE